MTTSTIPITVLTRAAAALKQAKDNPPDKPFQGDAWIKLMRSHSEIQVYLDRLLANQEVSVVST